MTSPSAAPRGRRFRITSLTIPASYVFIGALALTLLGQHLGSFVTLGYGIDAFNPLLGGVSTGANTF